MGRPRLPAGASLSSLISSTWFRRCLLVTGVAVGAFMTGAAILAIDGFTDSARESDVVIVLGNEVRPDATPTPRLAARLDAALKVHQAGLADHIIVSGGPSQTGLDEAEVMATYLIEAGVEPDRVIVDSAGVNTRATAVNAAAIMNERGWDSAIVATQFFHITRSRLALHQAGVEQVTTVHADYLELRDLYGLAREIPAWLKYRAGL